MPGAPQQCCCDSPLGVLLNMVWLDESVLAYHPGFFQQGEATWDADLIAFRLALQKASSSANGLRVPANTTSRAKPISRSFPDEIDVDTCYRYSRYTEAQIIEDFEEIRTHKSPTFDPTNIWFHVDNSGSMTTRTIQPAFRRLLIYVASNYPNATVTVNEFATERWLKEMADALNP